MGQAQPRGHPRRRLSLSVRLTLLVLFAALLPVAAVVGINDYLARGTLIQQGQQALQTDARSKAALIDSYLYERLLDGQALSSLVTTPAFLLCESAQNLPAAQAAQIDYAVHCNDPNLGMQFYAGSVCRGLDVGVVRDKNYVVWQIFDGHGNGLLTSATKSCTGGSFAPVSQTALGAVMAQGQQWISSVHYDPTSQRAFIYLYMPIIAPGQPRPVGFMRATLRLDRVWRIVQSDLGANGAGSSAFITDSHGVIIADTASAGLFTTIRPLDAATQQAIASEQRYGGMSNSITTHALPQAASALGAPGITDTFQGIATAGSTAPYQFVRVNLAALGPQELGQQQPLANLDWSYFTLSPLSTVTAVTDTQIRTSLESAAVIAVLAVLIGLLFGRGTTAPVRSSVIDLEGAAVALKELASRQENSASEQTWVVDACRTGLESVRYLSDAMHQAAKRIIDASNWFGEYWDRLTEDQARRTVQHLQELAAYIDEAAKRQQASSDRLDKAITVTMQVSEQLVGGAAAASDSADQLEQVVSDLQHVVGGRTHAFEPPIDLDSRVNGAGMTPPSLAPDMPGAMPSPLTPMPGPRTPVSSRASHGTPSGWPPSQGAPSGWPPSQGPASGWPPSQGPASQGAAGSGWGDYAPSTPQVGRYSGTPSRADWGGYALGDGHRGPSAPSQASGSPWGPAPQEPYGPNGGGWGE